MKNVSKRLVVAIAAICLGSGTGVISPVCASAEGLFPEQGIMATSYDSADINRDGVVELSDVLALRSYLSSNRYVNSYTLMDTNRNRVISEADLYHVLAGTVKTSYIGYVDGCSIPFYGAATSYKYTPSGQTTSCQYYRHVYSGTASDGVYTLSMQEAALPTSVASPDEVIGGDDRVPEYNTDMKTGICYTSSGGTGFVVGDHTIATAGHCVLDNKGWKSNLYVQFPDAANAGNTGSIGYVHNNSPKYYAVQAHVDKTYYDYCAANTNYCSPMVPYDYALITVSEDLSDRYHFNLGIPYDVYNSNYSFPDYNIYITGYPEDKYVYNNNIITRYLYTGVGNMYAKGSPGEHQLLYTTDEVGGDSGAPVYIKESYETPDAYGEFNTVVGINVAQNKAFNYGVIMTPIRMKFYRNNSQASYH